MREKCDSHEFIVSAYPILVSPRSLPSVDTGPSGIMTPPTFMAPTMVTMSVSLVASIGHADKNGAERREQQLCKKNHK